MYDIWGVFMEKISIIVPVYNEIDTLDKIVEKIENARFCGLEKEIIFVDDSSFDGSTDLLKKYEEKYKVFYHETNQGKGAAIRTAIMTYSIITACFLVMLLITKSLSVPTAAYLS